MDYKTKVNHLGVSLPPQFLCYYSYMNETLQKVLETYTTKYLPEKEVSEVSFSLESPKDASHGDLMTNLALVLSKKIGKNPREIANEIVAFLSDQKIDGIKKIEVAGPGFVNFSFTDDYFVKNIQSILEQKDSYGTLPEVLGQHTILEHSCPNAFKQFHIGHLMSNTIGESLGRIVASRGIKVTAVSYGGDVGLHVAKAIWAMDQFKVDFPHDADELSDKTRFLGNAYHYGSNQYGEDPEAKKKIDILNKRILDYLDGKPEAFDEDLDVFFTKGKEWSLEHFKEIYAILGSDLQYNLYESEVTQKAREMIKEGLEKGVLEESNGAVIYSEERSGLHTRVFQNSFGVPTYEGKDLGHAVRKDTMFNPYTSSIIITAEEQTQYFKVVLKALAEFHPEIAAKTQHVSHGFMKLPEGKMSSRDGTAITGEELIFDLIKEVEEKMQDRDIEESLKKESARMIAIAALKYSILRSAPGSDIVFDRKKALALDGDSGPYIQYTVTRAKSLIAKSDVESGSFVEDLKGLPEEGKDLARLLDKYSSIVERAYEAKAPHGITNYITEVAHEFNHFYHDTQVIGSPNEAWFISLVEATAQVLTNGLYLLGIEVPDRM